jgi:hypothetical protein
MQGRQDRLAHNPDRRGRGRGEEGPGGARVRTDGLRLPGGGGWVRSRSSSQPGGRPCHGSRRASWGQAAQQPCAYRVPRKHVNRAMGVRPLWAPGARGQQPLQPLQHTASCPAHLVRGGVIGGDVFAALRQERLHLRARSRERRGREASAGAIVRARAALAMGVRGADQTVTRATESHRDTRVAARAVLVAWWGSTVVQRAHYTRIAAVCVRARARVRASMP